jgi:hypothetical protein
MLIATPLLFALSLVALASTATAIELHLGSYRFDPLTEEPTLAPTFRALPPAAGEQVLAIVQFDGPITASDRSNLVDHGAAVIDYLPQFAFLVRARAPLAPLTEIDGVRWVGLHHPGFKLSARIGHTTHIDPERADSPDYLLHIDALRGDWPDASGTGPARYSVDEALANLGGVVATTTERDERRRLRVRLPKGLESALAHHPDVLWIEEVADYRTWNNTTRWVVQSNQTGVTPIWDQGLHGEELIAGVMDSGLDYASCWFRDHGNPLPGPTHRKVIDYEEWGGNAYDGCSNGHGTHVCGTLAGDQSYINPGNFNYNGIAYAAQLAIQDIGTDNWIA